MASEEKAEPGRLRYQVIREADERIIDQVVLLHHEALSYRSFITTFGLPFLAALYREILKQGIGFLVVVHEQFHVHGFTLGTIDSSRLLTIMIKRFYVFLPLMLKRLFSDWRALHKLFQTFFYLEKEDTNIQAELVVIVVDAELRSKGIGRTLLRMLDDEFLHQGIHKYKVTVHEEMKASNHFYTKNGMQIQRTFRMYGHTWNLFVREIDKK